jgi:hypothetical protein
LWQAVIHAENWNSADLFVLRWEKWPWWSSHESTIPKSRLKTSCQWNEIETDLIDLDYRQSSMSTWRKNPNGESDPRSFVIHPGNCPLNRSCGIGWGQPTRRVRFRLWAVCYDWRTKTVHGYLINAWTSVWSRVTLWVELLFRFFRVSQPAFWL